MNNILHNHKHHHKYDASCSCEHQHDHHGHDQSCSCGHQHEYTKPFIPTNKKSAKTIYILENLGCANCAAKMESKIQQLPGVSYASITFTTKQLHLYTEHPDLLLPQIQEICASIESGVIVRPLANTLKNTKQHFSTNNKPRLSKISSIKDASAYPRRVCKSSVSTKLSMGISENFACVL